MRLKDKRRLILAGVTLVVLALGLFSFLVVRGWQVDRQTDNYLAQAQASLDAGDHYNALGSAAQFIKRSPKDDPRFADALLIYAESRRSIEEADGRHLRDAKSFYEQYLARRPDDAKAQQTLLELYNQCGYFAEARDLALRMLGPEVARARSEPGEGGVAIKAALAKVERSQVPVLREGAQALLANKETRDPLLDYMLQRLLELEPLDLHGNVQRIGFLVQTQRKAEARALGKEIVEKHAGHPIACMVGAVARQVDPAPADHMAALALLSQAAGIDPASAERVGTPAYADAETAGYLVSILDGYAAFEHSLAVLRDGADRLKDSRLSAQLVRRLWQEDNHDAIERRCADLDPASPEVHADVLGFRALSLMRSGKPKPALEIAAALKRREGDYRATAWSKVIPIFDAADPAKPADAVATLQAVIKSTGRREPVFLGLLAESLASLGLSDEARKAWAEAAASPAAASWPTPWMRTAETLLAEGRAEEAAEAATRALRIAPTRVVVNLVWFEAQAARIQKGSGSGPSASEVLASLIGAERSLAAMSPTPTTAHLIERMLPPKVTLLVHTGRRDEAKSTVLTALEGPRPLTVDTLQRLAAVSARERLGIEAQCISAAEAVAGSSLSVAFTRALELAAAGQSKEGLARLTAAAAANPADPAGAIAIARYKERTGDSTALAAWTELGARHPDSLAVQQAILASPAAASDAAFIDATIERYASILGPATAGADDTLARTARARALLHGTPSRADRDKAVGILAAVVAAQPGNIDAKLMLASALSISDPARGITPDLPRATSQLIDASNIDPRSAPIALELARLYQVQGEFNLARDILNRVASDGAIAPEIRTVAAELLIAQGETPAALRTLQDVANARGEHAPAGLLVLLAESYISQRQEQLGHAIYERLADGAAADPESIYMTARYYAIQGDAPRAEAVLAKLDQIKLDPGVKEFVLARLAADRGRPDAVERYAAAVAAAPARADIWREFAGYHLRRGQFSQAAEVAQRGVAAVPGDRGLTVLLEQARTLAAGDPDPDIAELTRVLALGAAPSTDPMAEYTRAVQDAKSTGDFRTVDGLARLADRFNTSGQFQLFIARRLIGLSPERAANLASRAMDANPGDPAVAKGAAEVYLALGRFEDLLVAAAAWRERDISRSPEPDLAIAEAQLRLGRIEDGLRTLATRLEGAVKSVADKTGDVMAPRIVNINTRLLVARGELSAARRLVEPLLPSSKDMRIFTLDIAASEIRSADEAIKWIDLVRGSIPPDAIEELLIAATSYLILEGRFADQSDQLLKLSMDLLKEMAGNPKTAVPLVIETLGKLQHRTGDLTAAEAAYRQAIEMDPRRADSLNNLANILLEQHGDVDGALELAGRAVSVDPKPQNIDTLASIHAHRATSRSAAGDTAGAVSDFKKAGELYRRIAGLVAPAERTSPLQFAAQAFENAGDPAAALACYESLQALPALPPADLAVAKNNAAMCLLRLGRSPADLDRAASLVAEAIRLVQNPAFYDTQGWIELKAGRRQLAVAAFRQAVRLAVDPAAPPTSAVIGLATALAGGSPDQQKEAGGLLDGLGARGKLSPEDATRLAEARALLQPEGR